MKKTLSLILALLMSASCASFAFADEVAEDEILLDDAAIVEEAAEEEAEEVEEVSEYQEAIDFLNAYGIYKGYGDSKMGANDDIQRYQMALFTARIVTGWTDDAKWNAGVWDKTYTEFTDVNEAPAANYLGAISYANQNGIIEGYGDGTFGPTDGITYQNALTMVVRALGYGTQSWPWGYIEKAINLGLTDGITGVAYTDVLTRGEVAQVIYNALFAKTKAGDTLAAKNFDIEFPWQTIIITAAGGGFYEATGKATDEGVIAFKTVNTDGTLGEDTYYAKSSDVAFKEFTGHVDELAVGKVFRACYGTDGLLAVKCMASKTLWNEGADKTEVTDYLKGMTAVTKYTETTYKDKAGKIAYNKEVIIAQAAVTTKDKDAVVADGIYYDWTNNNIIEKQKDGTYTVAWYWNSLKKAYWKFDTKVVDGKETKVFYKEMTDDDAKKLVKIDTEKVNAYVRLDSLTPAAYASLEVFNLNGNDYAVYTGYKFGKISQTEKDCHNAKHSAVKIEDLTDKIVIDTLNEGVTKAADKVEKFKVEKCLCGACGDCEKAHDDIWWTDDYAPVIDEETEKIETNFVIYNYNPATNELRVLKTLEAETGVLRGYDVGKLTVNIDGETYSFAYDAFAGNMFATKDQLGKNYATKAITNNYLKNLFNQFVEFVVVDEKIVYVAAKGNDTNNLLVVESYAGVSSDGYIVVNAYSTSDLKLKQYKIGSYDGWEKGDYFYNLDAETAQDSFGKGVIYDVASYDKANDVYYVELVGSFYENDDYNTYKVYELEGTKALTDFALDDDGYISYKLGGEAKEIKASKDDKWVIIGNYSEGYLPMAVFYGKVVDKTWKVTGDYVKIGDTNIIVNATFTGFGADEYGATYVVMMSKQTASHDIANADENGYYLLGASTYTVNVFDLLKGAEDTVTAQNVKLVPGYTYIALDGQIVSSKKFDIDGAWAQLNAEFKDDDYQTAKYIYDNIAFDSAWINNDGFVKKEFAKDIYTCLGYKNYHNDFEVSGKVIALDIDAKGCVKGFKDVSKAGNSYWDDDTTYGCYYVYDIKNNSVVVYVYEVSTKTVTEKTATDTVIDRRTNDHDIEITSTLEYTETAVKPVAGATEKTFAIDSIDFTYTADADKCTHATILNGGFYFFKADHYMEDNEATINIRGDHKPESTNHGTVAAYTYDKDAECTEEVCNLVKSIKLDLTEYAIELEEDDSVTIEVELKADTNAPAYKFIVEITNDATDGLTYEIVTGGRFDHNVSNVNGFNYKEKAN